MVTATAARNTTTSKSRPAVKTAAKAPAKSATRAKSTATAKKEDAIDLLMADHAKVKKLFKQFEKLEDEGKKQFIAEEICMELTVHTKIEEEIFYPAVRGKIKDEDLMNEAVVEHDTAKDLIQQIQTMAPSDPMYDAKVIVLGEYIDHHVKEEHEEMFPKAKRAKVDLVELGQQMKIRKNELMSSFAH